MRFNVPNIKNIIHIGSVKIILHTLKRYLLTGIYATTYDWTDFKPAVIINICAFYDSSTYMPRTGQHPSRIIRDSHYDWRYVR